MGTITTQQQYNNLKQRVENAIVWLDSPERTNEDIDKFLPYYVQQFNELNRLGRRLGIADVR